MWSDVTKRIWLCSHLSHWFSLKSILRGSSHGLVIYVVIFLRTWVGTSTGTGHMVSCPVPRVMLWVLTMCSHTNVVGLYGFMIYVCLSVVRELGWVTGVSLLVYHQWHSVPSIPEFQNRRVNLASVDLVFHQPWRSQSYYGKHSHALQSYCGKHTVP